MGIVSRINKSHKHYFVYRLPVYERDDFPRVQEIAWKLNKEHGICPVNKQALELKVALDTKICLYTSMYWYN